MKIAKEFRWEMGHRLPFHEDKCKNLHGHSYKMMVEFEGTTDKNGMVLDYYIVKEIISPMVGQLDHAFLVRSDDSALIKLLDEMESKYVTVDFDSTAENLCFYFLEKISKASLPENIKKIKVKIFETETTYAEEELTL